MAETQPSRQDAKANIIAKALQDEDYRKALVADPKAVVEKELGVKLPESLTIEVLQETDDHACLVLPPTGGGEELTEAELARPVELSDCWLVCTSCSEWTSFEPSETPDC